MDYQYNDQNNYQNNYLNDQPPALGMGWYKFLIYFQLPVAMILSVGNILAHFNKNYGIGLSIYSIGVLLLVAFTFCVHYGLRKFIDIAPNFLLMFYVTGLLDAILQIIVCIRYGISPVDYVSKIIASIALLIVNSIYFSNRSQMFLQEDNKYKNIGYALFITSLGAILLGTGLFMSDQKQIKADPEKIESSSSYTQSFSYTGNNNNSYLNSETEKETEDTPRASTNTETESSTYNNKNSTIPDLPSVLSYEPAVIVEDTYTSSALNIKFTKPKGFEFADEAAMAENDGVVTVDPLSFSDQLKMDMTLGKMRTEMLAMNKTDGKAVQVKLKGDSRISIMSKSGQSKEDLMNMFTDDYMSQFIDVDQIKESWGAKDVTYSVSDGQLCVQPSKVLNVVLDFGEGISMNMDEYFFINDEYIGYIVVLADSKDGCDQLASCFSIAE